MQELTHEKEEREEEEERIRDGEQSFICPSKTWFSW